MDHQILLTCPTWKLIACCRAVVDSYRLLSALLTGRSYAVALQGWIYAEFSPVTETVQDCCGCENVPSIIRPSMVGSSERSYLI
jgi:hypothetical protein